VIVIREARPADAEAMIAFVQRLAAEPDIDIPMEPGEFRYTPEQEHQILQEYADADNSVFLLAEADGALVGELDIRGGKRKRTRHAATLGIAVQRGFRNRGVGNALLSAAIAWARTGGVLKRIELQVYARNQMAIHLYEKHGFRIEGRRQRAVLQNGEFLDDYVMALLL
jgi:ribosomal protein S18 acetylase RimI-like enzyme